MLIQFTVGNFRSFKDPVTLNLAATQKQELRGSNVIDVDSKLGVLKGAVIYGANASGKSNLLNAFGWMDFFIQNSVQYSTREEINGVKPFKLAKELKDEPSYFEVVFEIKKTIYRYGFEVTRKKVVNEWLYRSVKNREEELFLRQKTTKISINPRKFPEGKDLFEKTKSNALFLTVCAQFNGTVSGAILQWFLTKITIIDAVENNHPFHRSDTKKRVLEDANFRQLVNKLLVAADFGIGSLEVSKMEIPMDAKFSEGIPPDIAKYLLEERSITVTANHNVYDNQGAVVGVEKFDLFADESEGTQRYFLMLGPVYNALNTGGLLVIDELDSSLHPRLVWRVLGLFSSEKTNPKGAQLIFSTHDTSILSKNLLRRDQLFFMEKDRFGSSKLYSLVDFDIATRSDASFEKDYLKGKYGAVPQISPEMDQLISEAVTVH